MLGFLGALATLASVAVWLWAAPAAGPDADAPRGRLVLGLHPPERVAVMDLANGRMVERRLPGGALCHGPLMAGAGRVVFGGSSHGRPALMSYRLDLSGPARILGRGDLYEPSTKGRMWLGRLRYGRDIRLESVREVDRRGRVLLHRRTAPAGYPVGGAVGGLVLQHGSGLRAWNPRRGGPRRLTPRRGARAQFVAGSARRVAWCRGTCHTLRVGAAAIRPPTGFSGFYDAGAFSPDGSSLAVGLQEHRGSAGVRIALVRPSDRTVTVLSGPRAANHSALAWSPGGEWLFVPVGGRRIAAHRLSDGRTLVLPFRLPDRVLSIAAVE